ncbi:hypothetical protein BDN70DRAFT_936661 [Pholiota conissans]|uniref:Uncharacterized protein n=1 Tax=Pholiota conissans TaxID=109636 RepID=A0A9P6CPX3_9AGAR|nr:hypothetical protein BDN70DRAFT_936661 [Pholiota conissans]
MAVQPRYGKSIQSLLHMNAAFPSHIHGHDLSENLVHGAIIDPAHLKDAQHVASLLRNLANSPERPFTDLDVYSADIRAAAIEAEHVAVTYPSPALTISAQLDQLVTSINRMGESMAKRFTALENRYDRMEQELQGVANIQATIKLIEANTAENATATQNLLQYNSKIMAPTINRLENHAIIMRNSRAEAPYAFQPLQKSVIGNGYLLAKSLEPTEPGDRPYGRLDQHVSQNDAYPLGSVPTMLPTPFVDLDQLTILKLITFYNEGMQIQRGDSLQRRIQKLMVFLTRM